MYSVPRRCLLLVVTIAVLAGCGTATPPPTSTALPTEPRTSTPVPPTATPASAAPIPTHTPIPPTETPEPTATPRPTNTPVPTATSLPANTPKPAATKAVMSKPTATKSAAVPVPVQVSSQASSAPKSIEQALIAAQTLTTQLNQLLDKRADLCPPMLQTFNSLVAAPTYDMNGQPANAQQAYALYRGAIDRLNTLGVQLRTCGQSGSGTVEKNQLVPIISTAGDAANQLAQAWELVRYESNASSASPDGSLVSAIEKAMYDSDVLGATRHSKFTLATPRWWPYPTDVTSYPCDDYRMGYDRVVNAPTFDVGTKSGNAQAAYDKYRKAVATVSDGARPIYEACGRQEGQISDEMVRKLRGATSTAHELLSQAFALLNQ